jgi:hypothetical protein
VNVIPLATRTSEPIDQTETAGTEPLQVAEFSAPFRRELSGVIARLMSEAAQEVETLLAHAEAQSDTALQAAETMLTEQRRRYDEVAVALVGREKEVGELQRELQRERDNATTATLAFETAEGARLRAEAAILALQQELEGLRATTVRLRQQVEAEAAERTRLVATIRSVQEAFASIEPVGASAVTAGGAAEAISGTSAGDGNESDRTRRDELSSAWTSPDRMLTLVASAPAPITAPQPLLDYLDQLFGQLSTMYDEDQDARPLTEVVDRLTANLRCARDLFLKRAGAEGVSGAALFDQKLSEQLNGSSDTPLARHLAIAAHELAHPGDAYRRAEAS